MFEKVTRQPYSTTKSKRIPMIGLVSFQAKFFLLICFKPTLVDLKFPRVE